MDHSFPSNLVSPIDELRTQSRLQNRSNRRSSKDSVGISEVRAAMSGDKSAVIGVIIGLPILPLTSKRRQREDVAAPSSQDLFAIAAHRQSWSWATSLKIPIIFSATSPNQASKAWWICSHHLEDTTKNTSLNHSKALLRRSSQLASG